MEHSSQVGKYRGSWAVTEYQSFESLSEFIMSYTSVFQQLNKMKQQRDQLNTQIENYKKMEGKWKKAFKKISKKELQELRNVDEQTYNILIQVVPSLELSDEEGSEDGDNEDN